MLWTEVRDTGTGISSEDQDRLFKVFGKLQDTSKLNKSGMGLGLAISKMIVEKMGGDISVESELGKGSAFRFSFSVKETKKRKSDDIPLSALSLDCLASRIGNMKDIKKKFIEHYGEEIHEKQKLLIVDDNPYNIFVLKELIASIASC